MKPSSRRRWPAEWENQSAVLLCWPRATSGFNHEDSRRAAECLLAIAAMISHHETVLVTVPPGEFDPRSPTETLIRQGGRPERVRWIPLAADDIWFRDYGPLAVFEDGHPILLDFRFNGWGGKYPHGEDDQATRRLGQAGHLGVSPLESHPWILEGGSIDGDGKGTLLTTRSCLLHPNRKHPDPAEVEAVLARQLGIERVLWLDGWVLPGDDTDGHVDTLVRFASPTLLVYQGGTGFPDSEVRRGLTAMGEALARLRRSDGHPYDLVELPSPGPVWDPAGHPLPATYANFLVINEAVLVPQYRVPADAEVCRLLEAAFPDRLVYPLDARALVQQYGSIHCATLQLPWGVVPA